jgi:orotate phosphoribosyltransferase
MQEIIEELYKIGAVKIGEFTLTSGLKSPFYIDLRRIYSYPDLAMRIVDKIISSIDLREIDMIIGIATAGIPLATYIACKNKIPMGYIRIERKEHGTASTVEGDVTKKRIAVVDDVATTGGSIEKSIQTLKELGGDPKIAIVVVDREQGARERIERLGVKFYRLLTAKEIFRTLLLKRFIDEKIYKEILDYLEKTRSIIT